MGKAETPLPEINRSLGKPAVTSNQAKRLDSLGFAYQDLVQLYSNSKDKEDFITTLKKRGVNSKPLREKLAKLLQSRAHH